MCLIYWEVYLINLLLLKFFSLTVYAPSLDLGGTSWALNIATWFVYPCLSTAAVTLQATAPSSGLSLLNYIFYSWKNALQYLTVLLFYRFMPYIAYSNM